MKFIERMGLYFTVFTVITRDLCKQVGRLIKCLNTILINILCFISIALLEALTKAFKLATTTGQNRPNRLGEMLNHFI
jgi:hypothetical protein